jgi:diguanylate cyclase (GGDEF)-like protein/PAS domain S-box-containing protein
MTDVPGGSVDEFDSLEERYEHAPCGYLSTTPDGVISRVNQTLLDWTGYSRADLLDRPFSDLLDVGSHLFYETRYVPVLRLRGEAREVALTLRCDDGTALPVLVNAALIADGNGQPRVIRVAVFDSTARQDYERDLLTARRAAEFSEARVRVLQDASSAFGACASEEELAAALVQSARDAFAATAVAVFLVDEENGETTLAAGDSPLADLMVDSSRPEVETIASGRVVTIASVREAERSSPEIAAALQDARLESLSAVPLPGERGAVGALVCFFGRQRRFDEPAIELQRAVARQAAQVLGRVRLQRRLEHLALYDQLTGLATRKLLEERLAQVLSAAERSDRPMALVFLDLDGFKAINDALGHGAGDAVLRAVSDRLRSAVRQSDLVSRLGGDEFVVLCEDTDVDQVTGVAERIRSVIREPLDGIPARLPLTASLGIASHVSDDGTHPTAPEILALADDAMYRSKNAGKDRATLVRV